MAAPIGNEYWKIRTKHGRDKKFSSPKKLLDACNAYFQWCIENPYKEEHVVNKQWHEYQEYETTNDEGKTVTATRKITHPYSIATTNKLRPFTLEGLCNFIDISVEGFKLYEVRKGFVEVTTRVRQIIWNQKFEGAAINAFNANIIARDLGLIDKKDFTSDGKQIEKTPEEREERIKELIAKHNAERK